MIKKIFFYFPLFIVAALGLGAAQANANVSHTVSTVVASANADIKSGNYALAATLLNATRKTDHVAIDDKILQAAVATTYRFWSESFYRKGQLQPALDKIQQAATIAAQSGDATEQAKDLMSCGLLDDTLLKHDKAISDYVAAIAAAGKAHDQKSIAESAESIGHICITTGSFSRGLPYDQQADTIAARMHDVPLETISFTTTGQTYRALGQYSKALLFFQRSLPLAVKTKNIAAQATDTAGLGGINTDTGKYKIALPYDLQATALYARIGDQPSLEISGAYAGKAYQALNQLSNAASLYKQSLAASVICKDTDMQAYDLTNLAGVYTADGKFSDALDSDQQSLALDTKLGNQHNIELDLNNIGSDFSRLKKYSDAESYCLQSYKMAEKEGDKLRQHADLLNLAKLSFELGQHDKADKYAQQAAALGIK